MTLRTKTLIIIGVTLAGFLVALYSVSRIVLLGSFAKLEEQDARRNVDRVRSALADELATLDHICRDSATWDKTYAFIQNGDPEFIKSDIGYGRFSTLAQRRQNLLLYIGCLRPDCIRRGLRPDGSERNAYPRGITRVPPSWWNPASAHESGKWCGRDRSASRRADAGVFPAHLDYARARSYPRLAAHGPLPGLGRSCESQREDTSGARRASVPGSSVAPPIPHRCCLLCPMMGQ